MLSYINIYSTHIYKSKLTQSCILIQLVSLTYLAITFKYLNELFCMFKMSVYKLDDVFGNIFCYNYLNFFYSIKNKFAFGALVNSFCLVNKFLERTFLQNTLTILLFPCRIKPYDLDTIPPRCANMRSYVRFQKKRIYLNLMINKI